MIEMEKLYKRYFIGTPNELEVLKDVSLTIRAGEFVSIVGPSGSGKSTLMNILGALDRPTEGKYSLDGIEVQEMDDNELSDIRNMKIGFVFQNFNLIPRTSALTNVELPLFYRGVSKRERREKAESLLELVGMKDRIEHMPNELSGGQQQRVAIARSLANDPSIILADEPTGALDTKTGRLIMYIFKGVNESEKKTVILITHNDELAAMTDRIIALSDGEVVTDEMVIRKETGSRGGENTEREGAAV